MHLFVHIIHFYCICIFRDVNCFLKFSYISFEMGIAFYTLVLYIVLQVN